MVHGEDGIDPSLGCQACPSHTARADFSCLSLTNISQHSVDFKVLCRYLSFRLSSLTCPCEYGCSLSAVFRSTQ